MFGVDFTYPLYSLKIFFETSVIYLVFYLGESESDFLTPDWHREIKKNDMVFPLWGPIPPNEMSARRVEQIKYTTRLYDRT